MGRKSLEQKHFVESFSIAGVTFEGRQEAVKKLQPNQIVVLSREPWNAYDPAAVRIMDLLEQDLGFVPRQGGMNQRFTYEMAFGLVASMGPARDDVFGARVYARPDVPNLPLDPLILYPTNAVRFTDLPALYGERWPAVQAATLEAAQHRCEFTGLGQDVLPLRLMPHWRYNRPARAVQMVRLVAMCEPLAAAVVRLQEGVVAVAMEGGLEAARALQELLVTDDGRLFTEVNGIISGDALQYFELVRARCRAVCEQQWKVEALL